MYNIPFLLKEAVKAKSAQEFINDRYYNPKTKIFRRKFLSAITTVTMNDGNIFSARPDILMVEGSYIEYSLQNMKLDDVVLDIGANVGGFALRAARKADFVYAVEPIQYKSLEYNISLNNLDNIEIMKCGVGHGTKNITWRGTTKITDLSSLGTIIGMCGKSPTFLKIDCEGCEHTATADDLSHFRYIVGEIHDFDGTTPKICFINTLKSAGFEVNITGEDKYTMLFTAHKV